MSTEPLRGREEEAFREHGEIFNENSRTVVVGDRPDFIDEDLLSDRRPPIQTLFQTVFRSEDLRDDLIKQFGDQYEEGALLAIHRLNREVITHAPTTHELTKHLMETDYDPTETIIIRNHGHK